MIGRIYRDEMSPTLVMELQSLALLLQSNVEVEIEPLRRQRWEFAQVELSLLQRWIASTFGMEKKLDASSWPHHLGDSPLLQP